ncbi:phosphoglycerate mutase [Rhodoferax sp.]|uniref:phosphoglycerate mutase n=1 Tax=Rhodoferax sp. TaxID=50421 RepID=UPI0025F8D65D|nr:phosphoglycerate mutase [Rhodoferax sp.]
MHLLIPYAASHAEGCQAELATLSLPNLQKLLPRLGAQAPDAGDELSWSPPHERALAAASGLSAADGQIPWAALQARKYPELSAQKGGWAFVTLCHWQASMHEVTLRQIPMQDLGAAESDAFLNAMQPFFAQDGITLHPDQPGRWLAHGEVFEGLRSASPDRVLGRNLAPWMLPAAQAASLIRLMSEMQMLLYTHALNDAREALGALSINAIWISGTGVLADSIHAPVPVTVVQTLRDAALREDWAAWASAWQALDAMEIKALLEAHNQGQAVQLTLCGERHAQSWHTRPRTLMQKIRPLFGAPPVQSLLEKL